MSCIWIPGNFPNTWFPPNPTMAPSAKVTLSLFPLFVHPSTWPSGTLMFPCLIPSLLFRFPVCLGYFNYFPSLVSLICVPFRILPLPGARYSYSFYVISSAIISSPEFYYWNYHWSVEQVSYYLKSQYHNNFHHKSLLSDSIKQACWKFLHLQNTWHIKFNIIAN